MKWFREQGWEVSYASDGKEKILDCDHAYTFPFARSPFSSDNIKAYKMLKQLIQKEKFDIIRLKKFAQNIQMLYLQSTKKIMIM